jgi:putative phage-type endonuclease
MSEIIQGSQEWINSRLGKVTASRIADLTAKLKSGKPSSSREDYLIETVTERLTGQPLDFFQTKDMQWGVEKEPFARAAYEERFFVEVVQVAMVEHPFIAMAGASPDGLVEEHGLIEIKCPKTKTHVNTLLSGEAPEQYIPQMQWQMACTGRQWCDFVSFDPRLPEHLQMFVKRVPRNQALITQYEQEVNAFLREVEDFINRLNARKAA